MKPTITFSPAHTVVPTYECFNRCSYCNFRVEPGEGNLLSDSELDTVLRKLDRTKVSEILILSGEVHPQSPAREQWFTQIKKTCALALSAGFLPHTNVGPLDWQEMSELKKVNVSMGLMLEQVNPIFMETVHKHAPSKEPKLRSQQLEWAGELKIPFTTGILLGIGETERDIIESLEEIARIHRKWGHIQEVILQPHSVGSKQELNFPNFEPNFLPSIIEISREILPLDIAIQIPPNLVPEPDFLLRCLAAGATDLGGISPVDEVNPDYPHPTAKSLTAILEPAGWKLKPRLPLYPQYYSWLSDSLKKAIAQKAKELNFKN